MRESREIKGSHKLTLSHMKQHELCFYKLSHTPKYHILEMYIKVYS